MERSIGIHTIQLQTYLTTPLVKTSCKKKQCLIYSNESTKLFSPVAGLVPRLPYSESLRLGGISPGFLFFYYNYSPPPHPSISRILEVSQTIMTRCGTKLFWWTIKTKFVIQPCDIVLLYYLCVSSSFVHRCLPLFDPLIIKPCSNYDKLEPLLLGTPWLRGTVVFFSGTVLLLFVWVKSSCPGA